MKWRQAILGLSESRTFFHFTFTDEHNKDLGCFITPHQTTHEKNIFIEKVDIGISHLNNLKSNRLNQKRAKQYYMLKAPPPPFNKNTTHLCCSVLS